MKKIINGYEVDVKTNTLVVEKTVFVNYDDNFHLFTDKELSEYIAEYGYKQ